MYPLIIGHWEGKIISLVFSSKYISSILPWENIRETQTEGYSMKQLISTLQKCQCHKRQGKADSQIEGDSGDMGSKCYVESRTGSCDIK